MKSPTGDAELQYRFMLLRIHSLVHLTFVLKTRAYPLSVEPILCQLSDLLLPACGSLEFGAGVGSTAFLLRRVSSSQGLPPVSVLLPAGVSTAWVSPCSKSEVLMLLVNCGVFSSTTCEWLPSFINTSVDRHGTARPRPAPEVFSPDDATARLGRVSRSKNPATQGEKRNLERKINRNEEKEKERCKCDRSW